MKDTPLWQRILLLVGGLTGIQVSRMVLCAFLCFFLGTRPICRSISSLAIFLLLTLALLTFVKLYRLRVGFFPPQTGKNALLYGGAAIALAVLAILSPGVWGEHQVRAILTLCRAVIVIPLFEELLFRGLAWEYLEDACHSPLKLCLINALLFAVWQLGYADSLLAALHGDMARLPLCLLIKMATGFCYGLVLSLVRLKTKNCLATTLLHGALNLLIR